MFCNDNKSAIGIHISIKKVPSIASFPKGLSFECESERPINLLTNRLKGKISAPPISSDQTPDLGDANTIIKAEINQTIPEIIIPVEPFA